MHGLQTDELIQFARCNRMIAHAAQEPFAWKYTPLRVDSAQLVADGPEQQRLLATHPLLQHAPIRFRFLQSECYLSPFRLGETLDHPLLSRMIEFDASRCRLAIAPNSWDRILAHPHCRQLRVLCMHEVSSEFSPSLPADLLPAIVSLPLLHTLRLATMVMQHAQAEWSKLQSAPALTSLHVVDTVQNAQDSCIPEVAQCPKLLHLSILEPALVGAEFRRVFLLPRMAQLRSLTLDRLIPIVSRRHSASAVVPSEDFKAAFSSLVSLSTLRLLRCAGVNHMLPFVTAAPALRLLVVEPECNPWRGYQQESSAPHLASLRTLLSASRRLVIEVTLHPRWMSEGAPPEQDRDYATMLHKQLTAEVQRLSDADQKRVAISMRFTED